MKKERFEEVYYANDNRYLISVSEVSGSAMYDEYGRDMLLIEIHVPTRTNHNYWSGMLDRATLIKTKRYGI